MDGRNEMGDGLKEGEEGRSKERRRGEILERGRGKMKAKEEGR